MIRLAVIGTRDPNKKQIEAIEKQLRDVFMEHSEEEIVVVSGCAEGIDELALKTAFQAGLHTIGYLPWRNYHRHVQKWCVETHVVTGQEAFDSVRKYHPAADKLSNAVIRLHARNYSIVHNADMVIACPGHRPGGGGTGQGIRIAKAEGTPLVMIN